MNHIKSKKEPLQSAVYEQMKILRNNEAYQELKKLLDETYAFEDLNNQIHNIVLCLEESSIDLKLATKHESNNGQPSMRYLF